MNDDLISRQAAIDLMALAIEDDWEVGYATDRMNELPSAQPEKPIRCKDCKHFAGEGMYCANDIIVMFDHFYCYHAERKEGEVDG